MEFRCGRCKTRKDESDFNPSQRQNGKWCRDCLRARYRERVPAPPPRPCEQCGTTLEVPKPKQRFCSQKCKNDAASAAQHAEWLDRSADRTCEGCGKSLAGRRSNTRWCSAACSRRHPNRPGTRRRALLKQYGLTTEQYDFMVQLQDDRCGLCGTTEKGSKGVWSVDHDHVTGQTRMLLCSPCNTGIGNLRDDPALLRAAARYIESHRRSVTIERLD